MDKPARACSHFLDKAEFQRKHPMSVPSPELRRVRSRFMSFGIWTSAFAFFIIEGYFLHDQWEIGHASAMFMLGTALVVAGVCIGLFAIIAAVGLVISDCIQLLVHASQSAARRGQSGKMPAVFIGACKEPTVKESQVMRARARRAGTVKEGRNLHAQVTPNHSPIHRRFYVAGLGPSEGIGNLGGIHVGDSATI